MRHEGASGRLDDGRVRQFLASGYLALPTSRPAEFHADVFARLRRLLPSGCLADTVLDHVPELAHVLTDPVVRGALESLLGPGHLRHPHHAAQANPRGAPADPWHKETYGGPGYKVRSHRPWWLMLLYYPQETTPEMGPTGLIPGSQALEEFPGAGDDRVVSASCAAGTVYLLHYDLWHRRQENRAGRDRYLVKFEFTRLASPDPSDVRSGWSDPPRPPAVGPGRGVWRRHWAWLTAADPPASEDDTPLTELARRLDSADESAGLNATYEMAARGSEAVPALARALAFSDSDQARRLAAHGLAEAGEPAAPALLAACGSSDGRVRQLAAFALGESASRDGSMTPVLRERLDDPEPRVRAAAAEALGVRRVGGEATADALAGRLDDEDDEVRLHAALALARLGPEAAGVVPALTRALNDRNLYVRGLIAEAVDRLGVMDRDRPWTREGRDRVCTS